MYPNTKKDRNDEICNKILNGTKYEEISNEYNLTRQRIQQIFRRQYRNLPSQSFGNGLSTRRKRSEKFNYFKKKYNRETFQYGNDLEEAFASFFTRKKQNQKKRGWEWNITPTDLEWPTHCPVFGIELNWFALRLSEDSPTIDRIDNTKGYIPGNVMIISWRANRIKNDGTLEEHQMICEYLTRVV